MRILTDPRDAAAVPFLSLTEVPPSLVVGEIDGEAPYLFSSVGDVVPLVDGGVGVADEGTGQIRLFDSDGTFVRAFGALGGGPGEFGRLSGLRVVGSDTVVAWDDSRHRFTWFSSGGEVLRTLTVDQPRAGWPPAGDVLASGAVLVVSHVADSPSADGAGVYPRADSIVVQIIRGDEEVDTIGRFAGMDRTLVVEELQPGFLLRDNVSIPFGHETFARATGDRVLLARNDAFAVRILDVSGQLQEIWRFPGLERDLTSTDVATFESLFSEESSFPDAQEQFAVLLELFPPADRIPAFSQVLSGTNGTVWLAEYPVALEGAGVWWVLAEDGRLLGGVGVPAGLEVRAVGEGAVLGVVADELGVERVFRYDFEVGW